MTIVDLYYPETTATKQISDVDGRIFFNLSYNIDLSGNFAKSPNDIVVGYDLFINSAENFPSLSDPNYSDNLATHYLVIFQKNLTSDISNCIAIPICNNYNGPWNMYAKDLKKTQVRSIDKLIKNQTSTIIDLNSTMNELTGIGSTYKRYNNIVINYQNNNNNTMNTTLYVIDKFIYVEPVIKPSLYKQLITNNYTKKTQIDDNPNKPNEYIIVSVSAACGNPKSTIPSPLFDIGKNPDEMSKFIYMNVLIIVVYLIILLLFYNYHETIPPWGLLIICIPLFAYLFMYTLGKNKKEKMENIESFRVKKLFTFSTGKKRKGKKRKGKKLKPVKINYSDFLKYTLIGSYYSIAIVSMILLLELYKKMNSSTMNFVDILFKYVQDGVSDVGSWITNLFKTSSGSGDEFINNILKPVLNAGSIMMLIFLLFLGVNELIMKKIIRT